MAEQDRLQDERRRLDDGAPPRDLSEYSTWRDETDNEILEAMSIYGDYLMGQTNGMSDALSLPALVAAFDIEGVEADERSGLGRMIIGIHWALCGVLEARRKRAKHG